MLNRMHTIHQAIGPHQHQNDRALETVSSSHPNWQIRRWNDTTLWSCINSVFPELSVYVRQMAPIVLSDVGRYCVLYKYGGFYLDSDVYCTDSLLSRVNDSLSLNRVWLASSPPLFPWGEYSFTNYAMFSPRKHRFWLDVREALRNTLAFPLPRVTIAGLGNLDISMRTGAFMLTAVAKRWNLTAFPSSVIENAFCEAQTQQRVGACVHVGGTARKQTSVWWGDASALYLVKVECAVKHLVRVSSDAYQLPLVCILVIMVHLCTIIWGVCLISSRLESSQYGRTCARYKAS